MDRSSPLSPDFGKEPKVRDSGFLKGAKAVAKTAVELNGRYDPFNYIDGLGWHAIKYGLRAIGSAIAERARSDNAQHGDEADEPDYPRYLVNGRVRTAKPRVGAITGRERNVPYSRMQNGSRVDDWRYDLSEKAGRFIGIGSLMIAGAWVAHGGVYLATDYREEMSYSEFFGETVMGGIHGLQQAPEIASQIVDSLMKGSEE